MLFAIQWQFTPENRDVVQARFKETGAPPPDGVKMLGRWHLAEGHGGMLICDADDAVQIGIWMQQWNDLLEFDVTPVNDDEGVMKVLNS